MNKAYHDDNDSYVDDDFPLENTKSNINIIDKDNTGENKLHYTNTTDYNSSKLKILTPEEENQKINGILVNDNKRFANPEVEVAVDNIEKKLGREINEDEYDKLCRTYANILVEHDINNKKLYKDISEEELNSDRKLYYDMLIQNRQIVLASRERMSNYEETMIAPIEAQLDIAMNNELSYIKVKQGKPINLKHHGKVAIAEDDNGRTIIIDNERDVKLLHMKYRQDWLDKRYDVNSVGKNRPPEEEWDD